jgi:hypothetical protein
MRPLISALLFVCAGTFVTWLTASLIEFNALAQVHSAPAYYAEQAAPIDHWAVPKVLTKAPVAALTTATLLH